jgi:hypothetical protein
MKKIINESKKHCYFILVLMVFLLTSNALYAAYEINKYSINNGGSKIVSSRFQLVASIAQVDASQPLNSNTYKLSPGYWQQNTDLIFTNGFK